MSTTILFQNYYDSAYISTIANASADQLAEKCHVQHGVIKKRFELSKETVKNTPYWVRSYLKNFWGTTPAACLKGLAAGENFTGM